MYWGRSRTKTWSFNWKIPVTAALVKSSFLASKRNVTKAIETLKDSTYLFCNGPFRHKAEDVLMTKGAYVYQQRAREGTSLQEGRYL